MPKYQNVFVYPRPRHAPTDTPCPLQWGKTALDIAEECDDEAKNEEVKAALRQHGAKHSLFYAAEKGMLELVADLIKEGADVNEKNHVSLHLSLSLSLCLHVDTHRERHSDACVCRIKCIIHG
jgi:hypothetical protein